MSAEPSYPGVAPPPSGVIPDLAHPPDAGRALLLVWVTVCDVLATVFFLTRVYVKIWVTRKILIEDGTCTIAWALMLLYSATVYLMAHHGEGHHAWDVSREAYSQILKWLYAGSIVYCPTAYFTKVTLLLLIARVFAVRECVANSIHIFIFALLVAYLPIQIAKTVVCTPVRAYWDSSVHGTCLNQRKIFLSDISLAIFTDFIILLIPVPLTWSLRTPIRKKIKIVALLSAGGIATAVTVFRLYLAINFVHSTDVTSDFVAQNITYDRGYDRANMLVYPRREHSHKTLLANAAIGPPQLSTLQLERMGTQRDKSNHFFSYVYDEEPTSEFRGRARHIV